MPLNRSNTRTFHRCLYGDILETVTLLKRGDDQQMGTVTSIKLFQCRRRVIQHTGEPLLRTQATGDRTEWMIPRVELDRVGVAEINALDRIVDKLGFVWQPEAPDVILIRLFRNFCSIPCRRAKD